jgi:hypothetical protein
MRRRVGGIVAQQTRGWTRVALRVLGVLAVAAALATGAQADATDPSAPNVGTGKCRYSESGKLVFSPRGASCPAYASPPAEIALDSELAPRPPVPAPPASTPASAPAPEPTTPTTTVAAAKASAQPALAVVSRGAVSALLAERRGLDDEILRIRDALTYDDREAARRVIEGSLVLISEHLEREERVLKPLAAASGR